MSRSVRLFVGDVLTAIRKIETYTLGETKTSFASDELTLDAVLFNLQVIGEAVKNIPQEIRQREPGIDWRGPARMRDVVAHHYFGVNPDLIWDVVENYLPGFRVQMENLYKTVERLEPMDSDQSE